MNQIKRESIKLRIDDLRNDFEIIGKLGREIDLKISIIARKYGVESNDVSLSSLQIGHEPSHN